MLKPISKIKSGRAGLLLSGLVVGLAVLVAYAVQTSPIKLPDIHKTLGAVEPGFYRVVEVADGDTITVSMGGAEERIRMIGVDTPETHHPEKPVQCFGVAASNFTKDLLDGKTVRLESDPENTNRDRYNRLLRYVYTESGELVNKKIISDGYGFAYTSFPFTKLEEFRAAEAEARQTGKGLWSDCKVEINGGYPESKDL